MLTDDATLTYMKAGYLEGDRPSRGDALEMIDEIKRLRTELAAFKDCPSKEDLTQFCFYWNRGCSVSMATMDTLRRVTDWLRRIAAMKEGEG